MIMNHPSEDSPDKSQEVPADGTPIPSKKEVQDTEAYQNDDVKTSQPATEDMTAAQSDPSAEKREEVERYRLPQDEEVLDEPAYPAQQSVEASMPDSLVEEEEPEEEKGDSAIKPADMSGSTVL